MRCRRKDSTHITDEVIPAELKRWHIGFDGLQQCAAPGCRLERHLWVRRNEVKRHQGDSNPCGQSPMDFESISLTARTQCLWKFTNFGVIHLNIPQLYMFASLKLGPRTPRTSAAKLGWWERSRAPSRNDLEPMCGAAALPARHWRPKQWPSPGRARPKRSASLKVRRR